MFLTYNVRRVIDFFGSTNFRHYTRKAYEKLKPPWNVLFFGTDEFSVSSLKALRLEHKKQNTLQKLEVVTSIKNKTNPVRKFAIQEDLVLHEWPLPYIDSSFHIGVVVSFGYLIPENIINSFPLGMLNVHASLLPRWRGAAPIIYAIANGDDKTGVTIMQIKPDKFDVGEIILQEETDIPTDASMPVMYNKLAELGAQALMKSFNELPNILYNAKLQPDKGITYAPRINSSFAAVNWDRMTAADIYNLERSLTSLYPLSTKWNDVPIKLFGIKLCDKPNLLKVSTPGFIIYDKHDKLIKVHCVGGKWISVENVGVHQKKVMTARDFYNGFLSKQFDCRVFR